jgi:hypothetical protein
LNLRLLALLAGTLPLAVILSSQLRIYCIEQGDCSPPIQLGAWLLVPLIIAWSVVMLMLVVRAGRWMLSRKRGHAPD